LSSMAATENSGRGDDHDPMMVAALWAAEAMESREAKVDPSGSHV
jgi:hypothetical protein